MSWKSSHPCRQKILAQYAQQLSDKNLATLSEVCLGMSGRDLRDVCESAERRVASKVRKCPFLIPFHHVKVRPDIFSKTSLSQVQVAFNSMHSIQ